MISKIKQKLASDVGVSEKTFRSYSIFAGATRRLEAHLPKELIDRFYEVYKKNERDRKTRLSRENIIYMSTLSPAIIKTVVALFMEEYIENPKNARIIFREYFNA